MQFKLGELFCGAGGLAWGAVNAGRARPIGAAVDPYSIVHTWANDLDPWACRTYAANIVLRGKGGADEVHNSVVSVDKWLSTASEPGLRARGRVICGSVVQLAQSLRSLPAIDALAFGFPCNDFSTVGERKGLDGDFGPLYTYGVTILDHHKPRWFLAENVEGLLHRDKGEAYKQIRAELEVAGPGYVITEHLYRFEEYGVPQRRTRLVIVGISKPDAANGVVFRVPAPTSGGVPRTARWAMEHDPAYPRVRKPLTGDVPNNVPKPMADRVRKRLDHTRPGENAWNADIPAEYALKVKNAHLSMIYRRLVADEPAYTITGNGGGGTHGYHWEESRALTNRERARLQSFPDSFIFHGGEETVRRQVGMAVPPVAAKVIFEAILKSYAGVPYAWSDPSTLGSSSRRTMPTVHAAVEQ